MSIMDIFRRLDAEKAAKTPAGKPEWLIVGLGNPGKKYELTRHNVGFIALETLAGVHNIPVKSLKFRSICGQGVIGGKSVLLMMPQTFMNLSGEAVLAAAQFYKIPNEKIIVLYDDISLPVGKLRARAKGSAGGHNGIKNIIQLTGSDVFPRIKIGVGAPPHPDYDVADWVLGTFGEDDKKVLTTAIDKAVSAVPILLNEGVEKTASSIN
ncbi:MAG: aminoacyl-tRNA hydrolase [Clostridia bacterium]|nr:aminoacyl-tRNA hydrolase [Clostridia bacterium]